MRPEQERVKKLLTEAVTLLCRNSLQYEEEVTVEGLIGITLDQRDIFLVSIHETVENAFAVEARKRKAEEEAAAAAERPESPKRKRERKRHSSRDSESSQTSSPRVRTKEEPSGLLMDVEEAQDDQVVVKKERLEGSVDGTDSRTTDRNDARGQRTDQDSDQDRKGWHQDNVSSHNTTQDPTHRQGQNHDRMDGSNFSGPYTTPQPPPDRLQPHDSQINVKQETDDGDDACFVIDSDDDDLASDSSRSNPVPQFLPNLADTQLVPTQGWPGGGGGGDGAGNFDPDLLATAQQFGSQKGTPQGWPAGFDVSQLSQMSGGSGGDGSMSFLNASPGSSRQFQMAAGATGQTPDGQQRSQSAVFCQYCGKGLSNVSHLKRHVMDVHHRVRRYRCDFCEMAFTQNSSRTRHMKVCKRRPDPLVPSTDSQTAEGTPVIESSDTLVIDRVFSYSQE